MSTSDPKAMTTEELIEWARDWARHGLWLPPTETNELASRLEVAVKKEAALQELCVAYRLGSQTHANRALNRLDKLKGKKLSR